MKTTSIKIMLFGIALMLISLFLLGVSILQGGGSTGGAALVALVVGIAVCIVGFLWDIKT